MAQLGLGLGAQIKGSNSFDPDALRYFATAGVTDATGRSQINTFVRGIKSLGLYNNMVAWPLRSTQNAGTGVTAYSLGGLGTYDGTLTNGPTWGTGGVTFDGTDDYLPTTFTTGLSELTAFSVATLATLVSPPARYEISKDSGTDPNKDFGIYAIIASLMRGAVFPTTFVGPSPTLTIRSFFLRASSSVLKLRRNNGGDITATPVTPNLGNAALTIGARADGQNAFLGTIHASILFNKVLTDSETSSMYTLYSTTLGSGLGLP